MSSIGRLVINVSYVIVYWSRYGNGKRIVETLQTKLKKDKKTDIQVFTTDEADPTNMPKADLYVFSAPAEAFNVQKNMRKFMKKLESMDDKKYAIINTHSMKNKNWLHKMEKLLSKKNMVKVADVDFVIGKEGQQEGKGHIDGWENKLDDFVKKI